MRKKVWSFKDNSEIFSVLYEDDMFILVFNDDTEVYSFGLAKDFDTLYGFPVNWSCLNLDQLVDLLSRFILIDEKHARELGRKISKKNIQRWQGMKDAAVKFSKSGYTEV